MSGNKESCPFCGSAADVAEGIFNITNNIISVISSPSVTKTMLVALETSIKNAYINKTPKGELADEVTKIDPSFGDLVRNPSTTNRLYFTFLLLLLAFIKSCNINVKLDANQLVDQIRGVQPSITTSGSK